MRLSVRAARSARPELFVNYISGSFIAPEPRATEKPPPPPQTASRAPGAPASRRPSCNDSTGPEVSVSPTRDVEPERVAGTPAQEGRGRRAGQVPPATALSPREAWTNFADLVALARTVSVEQLPGGSSGVFAEIGEPMGCQALEIFPPILTMSPFCQRRNRLRSRCAGQHHR
ncbi:uncharacterized protein LOC117068065 isoform X4 [Trachypithecus francoisi]|uniref:uncharacterized protein LOC117068065 isoform X4 n=1 Tax=Trachypithecus francoisi TaxID=54180 RepID=UPI00141B21DD|nr:uncharacterized protein LOC117068065 isoform X4 [Trachypithecus francoisi]